MSPCLKEEFLLTERNTSCIERVWLVTTEVIHCVFVLALILGNFIPSNDEQLPQSCWDPIKIMQITWLWLTDYHSLDQHYGCWPRTLLNLCLVLEPVRDPQPINLICIRLHLFLFLPSSVIFFSSVCSPTSLHVAINMRLVCYYCSFIVINPIYMASYSSWV